MKITFEQFEKLLEDTANARESRRLAAKELDIHKKIVSEFEASIEAALEELDKKSYKGETHTATMKEFLSWKVPSLPEKRSAYRSFLEERGIFDTSWSVSSKVINADCTTLMEDAVARGDVDFKIDGLEEPTPYYKLSFTKNK